MTGSHASRPSFEHIDGTRIFHTVEDRRREAEIAEQVEKAWSCRIRSFGALSPIDWYAERAGRVVGVLELKSRSHTSVAYETVFLNVRKWLALSLAAVGLGCPAVFIVRFTDTVLWTPIAQLNATGARIAGCAGIVKNANDIEPIIDVPIRVMRRLLSEEEE